MDFEGHVAVIIDFGTDIAKNCRDLLLERKARVLISTSEDTQDGGKARSGSVSTSIEDAIDQCTRRLNPYRP